MSAFGYLHNYINSSGSDIFWVDGNRTIFKYNPKSDQFETYWVMEDELHVIAKMRFDDQSRIVFAASDGTEDFYNQTLTKRSSLR